MHLVSIARRKYVTFIINCDQPPILEGPADYLC